MKPGIGRAMVIGMVGIAMLLGLPLLGVWLDGQDVTALWEFPPRTVRVQHAPFSWPVFIALALLIIAVLLPFIIRVMRTAFRRNSRPAHRFPWWGCIGIVITLAAWILAWGQFAWLSRWQTQTFSMIWLGYIIIVNALNVRRCGTCMLLDRPRFFLCLFPISAVTWWFFEYLNRFVQNWHYEGVGDMSSGAYVVTATLPFATVLPAVLGTAELLQTFPRMTAGLERVVSVPRVRSRSVALSGCLLAGVGLAGIGIWPDLLFPLLWVSPFLIIVSLEILSGAPSILDPLTRGDWRRLCSVSVAALICGFFWELWNVYSLPKWIYMVPYVQRFHLFEMPLLGYSGYLPFGLECLAVGDLLARAMKAPRPAEYALTT